MPKPRVFVTRAILPEGLKLISDFCEMDLWPGDLPPQRADLLKHVPGVEGILSLLTDRLDGEILDAAGAGLKVISNYAVGYDNIDVALASARKIAVGNTPGVLTDATADFAFSLLLAAARRVVEADRQVRSGQWKTWGPSILLGTSLYGTTLGLVGFGRIGQAMAKRASGFEMRVLYYDPSLPDDFSWGTAKRVDFETLLRESDFVSLHTPLTAETYHLINQHAFSLMKTDAILVNTARGPVVDSQALYRALKDKRIFAAALDVTEPEPLPVDSPLLSLENLIIAPHIASGNQVTRRKMSIMAAENLIAGLKGEPLPNCVNPQIYE
ncbi:MAG: D-glycerate dehydrogenase [Anaerolineae bacterium]|nr:D-glycerate dehydrogenase [Anaerolineae bacterium]